MAEETGTTKAKRKMGDGREKAKNSKTKPSPSPSPTIAKWPLVKPKQDLQITRLKDTDLFTICIGEGMLSLEGISGSLGPTKGEAYRDNDRISVTDPLLANAIWESGLNKLFSDIKIRGRVAVGLNPNLRFYRYNVGQRFGRHIDESVDLGEGKRTHYTLLIYLSGGSKSKAKNDSSNHSNSPSELLVGGETVFYNSRNGIVAEVAPAEGMALLHIHGDKCMLHEARNVTKGVKYVFRSDIAFA
ncbi:uncharacterized protein LOC115732384 isoform X3 [Rhodamnia argentea]|uniref:Uncharacterized protein LOC115732384 isoform X3 n=1 Tax=Rhodamnia argentea TaxID=178133 RepID=A0ABM3GSN2_9MYRT|nr:uncharacterized protein LOC115732384 isoform X3 [Rhodamnia argentea]